MERNSLTNSVKDQHSIGSRAMKDCINDNKIMPKISANCDSQSFGDEYVNGFSWPPRSYTCSFCKREFKSAQALGGHMNVHRRDRARLRQSPPRDGQYPFLNLNCNPNPNPNKFSPSSSSSLSSSSTRLTPFAFPLPSFICPTLPPLTSPSYNAYPIEVKKRGCLFDSLSQKIMDLPKLRSESSFNGDEEFDGFKERDGRKIFKKHEIARLDLGVGLLCDSKEDIDLELRLGNS